MLTKFEQQRHKDKQSLFREKEVDNLRDLIYNQVNQDGEGDQGYNNNYEDSEYVVDTNRFQVSMEKLKRYLVSDVKKLLKCKFVTGQSQDQIMKNLLNMSDSDEEEKQEVKKLKSQAKKRGPKGQAPSDTEESDSEEEGAGDGRKKKKSHKDEAMVEKQEEEKKKKELQQKQVSLFLGESHGHYKMGTFVRIELSV